VLGLTSRVTACVESSHGLYTSHMRLQEVLLPISVCVWHQEKTIVSGSGGMTGLGFDFEAPLNCVDVGRLYISLEAGGGNAVER